MGKLTDRIEEFLLSQPEGREVFPTGGSWDQNSSKHMRVRARRDKEDAVFDLFDVQIELRSDEFLQEDIHVDGIQRAFERLEDKHVVKKIIRNGHEITNSDLALYNSAVINFLVITNIEKS